jgi:hypothetical protein
MKPFTNHYSDNFYCFWLLLAFLFGKLKKKLGFAYSAGINSPIHIALKDSAALKLIAYRWEAI